MTSAIYLEADTVNGITYFDYADMHADMEFVSPEVFSERLDGLEDGEVIRTIITHPNDPVYAALLADYGIN